MKRVMVLLFSLLVLFAGQPLFAADGDAYSNAKANFWVFNQRNLPGASAYAIINYAKGANKWVVTGEIMDARVDNYVLSVGTSGTCSDNFEITQFTTDSSGYATFGAQIDYDEPANIYFPTGFNIVRIYKAGNACNTELTAPAGDGSLKFRGLNRLEPGFVPAMAE